MPTYCTSRPDWTHFTITTTSMLYSSYINDINGVIELSIKFVWKGAVCFKTLLRKENLQWTKDNIIMNKAYTQPHQQQLR